MSVDGMWYVKLADGDVDRVTLDQLDEAFQKGQVDENSMVLADGAEQWMKLADLLGLSEPAAPAAAAQAAPLPASMPPLPPGVARTLPPPIVVQAPALALPSVVTQRPIAAPPALATPPSLTMPTGAPTASLRPVSVDLGGHVDLGELPFRSSSRKRWVVGALGTALVLGAGAFFVITKTAASARADAIPALAAAAPEAPPAPVTPPPAPVAADPPPATNAGPSPVMDPTQRPALTDEQKRKVLETDKSAKSRVKSRSGGGGGSSRPKEKSSAFTTSGNKYDPLNSSL